MRILVSIAHQGHRFFGSQIQRQGRIVQRQLERTLKRMYRRHVRVYPSSRTDHGVHAYEQYFHSGTELNIGPKQWRYATDNALPGGIYVNSVKQVNDTFHCRYDCIGKRHRYKVYQTEHRSPFESGLKTFIEDDLDLDKINEAARHFVGTRDFTGSCSQKTEAENREHVLYQGEVVKTGEGSDYIVTGSGFLYDTMHVFITSLVEAGRGKRQPNEVPELLRAKSRDNVPLTAPAGGLYLEKIYLDPEVLKDDFDENVKIYYKKSLQSD